uniref:Methyltransferase FkbM domain-containing protein n=1 Tax=Panagrolaimus superbus TaxID=310955 RepID=A0A914YSE7_9BILA
MSVKVNFTHRSRIFSGLFLVLVIVYYHFAHYSKRSNLFDNSRSCLSDAFQRVTLQNFLSEWLNLNKTIDKCNKELLKSMTIVGFQNSDETKFAIMPKYLDSTCNVITLGIGNDVLAEKQMSKQLSQCTFLGIDPDAKYSGNLYISDLKGVYVQGVVGLNGSTKAVPIEKNAPLYPNFSFENFISIYYPHHTLDYLLMDIEGDEWALMKDLIGMTSF